MVQSGKIIIVRRDYGFGWPAVLARCAFYTFVINLLMRFVFVSNAYPIEDKRILFTIHMITIPLSIAVITFLLYPRLRGDKLIVFSGLYAVGLLVWSQFTWYIVCAFDITVPLLFPEGMVFIITHPLELVPSSLIGSAMGWGMCRWFKGKVVVQDGTLCPKCGYCLIGNIDRICPECGREFTFQELDTTGERLVELARTAR